MQAKYIARSPGCPSGLNNGSQSLITSIDCNAGQHCNTVVIFINNSFYLSMLWLMLWVWRPSIRL